MPEEDTLDNLTVENENELEDDDEVELNENILNRLIQEAKNEGIVPVNNTLIEKS